MTGREQKKTVLIAGGGQCAAWCARTLRDEGFDGRVTILSAEAHLPYERPPLSKSALQEEVEPKLFFSAGDYQALETDVRLADAARHIDVQNRHVETSFSGAEAYDFLVICTGADARRLAIAGHHLKNVFYLRSLPDAVAIRRALIGTDGDIVVIGGGWIGLEIAATAKALGRDVTVIETATRLCARSLPSTASDQLLQMHQAHGVKVLLAAEVAAILGHDSVEQILLKDGRRLNAAAVIVGIGIVPNASLACSIGLSKSQPIVTDYSGATTAPGIFAGGDVAAYRGQASDDIRYLESWENAQIRGIAIAKSIVGTALPKERSPWFWSDQYNFNIQLLGQIRTADQCFQSGLWADGKQFSVFLSNGRFVGAMGVNAGREIRTLRKLLDAGRSFDRILAKSSDPISELLKLRP